MLLRTLRIILFSFFISSLALAPRLQAATNICGDVNNDGRVSVADALIIMRYVVALPTPDMNLVAADVNQDGRIDISDALMIERYIVGLSTAGTCL